MAQQSPVRLMLRLHSGVKDIDRTVNLVRDVLMSGVPEVGDEIAVDAGETRLVPVAKRHSGPEGDPDDLLRADGWRDE